MYHLVYISSARPGFGKAQIRTLLNRSRRKNTMLGITGLMLHHEGKILQVLEGEERTVRALYEVIQADPRHIGCTVLLEETTPARQYPHWPMTFRDLDGADLEEPAMVELPADLSEAQKLLLHLHFGRVRPRLPAPVRAPATLAA